MKNKPSQIIGADESGVGDYFGPVVFAACYFKDEFLDAKIDFSLIKDSKQIKSDQKIQEIFLKFKKMFICSSKVISQEKYNFFTQKKVNANEIKMLGHLKTLNNICLFLQKKQIFAKKIVVDRFVVSEKSLQSYQDKFAKLNIFSQINLEITFEVKAESKFLEVAFASIVARVIFLEEMQKQRQKYDNFNFLLGSSEKVIDNAIKFCQIFGKKKLIKVAKIHFKTTEKVLEKLNKVGNV